MAIKLEGERGKALVARPLMDEFFFFGFPYLIKQISKSIFCCGENRKSVKM